MQPLSVFFCIFLWKKSNPIQKTYLKKSLIGLTEYPFGSICGIH